MWRKGILSPSGATNNLYCYHYRQPGYDPQKNPDVMEPEYRTRKEIAEDSGIDEIGIDNVTVSVYPNPAVGSFHIKAPAQVDNVTLYNLSGAQIKTVASPEGNTVNIDGLASGLYLVNINVGGQTATAKLIVK